MKNSSDVEIRYSIEFEDEEILILNKPCGVPVQAEGNDLVKSLEISYRKTIYPITRIDQPVSGLVLFAKTAKSASYLSKLIRNRKIFKSYLAVIEGHLPVQTMSISHNLAKKGNKTYETPNGQEAILKIEKVKLLEKYTVVIVTTTTGRFHQIRSQLSIIGHPIKGDVKYGARRSNKEGGIYLHCRDLRFNYLQGKDLYVSCQAPNDKPLFTT